MPLLTAGGTLVAVDADTAVPTTYRRGARIVRTPLDLIQALDARPDRIVLLGAFARERSFAVFIREVAPASEVIAVSEDRTPETGLQLCYA